MDVPVVKTPSKACVTYPSLGTRIRIKQAVRHNSALLPTGYTGVVLYVNHGQLIEVKLDQRIEELALWKNCITFYTNENRDALTWFSEECEILERMQ